MKTKEISEKAGAFAKGGKTKMFGKMGVKTRTAGVSAEPTAPGMDKMPAKGGPARSHSQGASVPARPGQTSPGGIKGSNTFGVSGGKTKMAGKSGADTAKPV